MHLRPLFLAALLLAASFSLGRALITRQGVGAFEYATGAVLLGALLLAALRLARRGIGRA